MMLTNIYLSLDFNNPLNTVYISTLRRVCLPTVGICIFRTKRERFFIQTVPKITKKVKQIFTNVTVI